MDEVANEPNIVKLMRKIRDQFSSDIQDMSLEQQRDYMKKFVSQKKRQRKAS